MIIINVLIKKNSSTTFKKEREIGGRKRRFERGRKKMIKKEFPFPP